MTLRDLTKRARWIFKQLGIERKIRVRELKRGFPWYYCVYGLLTVKQGGVFTVWMRRTRTDGSEYTRRFQLSVLAHEIAHVWHTYHSKGFKSSQNHVTMLLRKYPYA